MAAPLTSLLHPDRIRVGFRAVSKTDLLRQVVDLVASAEGVEDPVRVLRAVQAREAQLSTGVGQGLAFPHARTSAVQDTVAAFVTLAAPVEFEALDGAPVRLVLLLAGPEGDRGAHVRLLSRVSRVLAQHQTREALLAARTPEEIVEVFAEAEAALR